MEMTNDPERAPIVIVGGGLAGLTCATILWRSGIPIQLFEKAASVGGRLSTTRLAEGFQIDQGFQVIFDAYPALRRHIDVTTIPHRSFTSGLSVWTGR
ncbi:MAG: amine oxidase, partial [Chloroflexota bacterium]